MAFQVVQTLSFSKPINYKYDRVGDVLYLSFGPVEPAIAIQVEDWLAIRIRVHPPSFAGMTIVGFREIFQKVNRYVEHELPQRVKRLERAVLTLSYDDSSDTLIMRLEERAPHSRISAWFGEVFGRGADTPTVFEPLVSDERKLLADPKVARAVRNIYVEKAIPVGDIVGVKILEYTKCGPAAIEAMFGTLIDSIFEDDGAISENAHLIANAVVQQ
ncbi:MAG: hypothetical protein ACRD2L_21120, partial [Terriglobia bacterium]